MKKFLIIQTASIGDVVLATSLIETIYFKDKNAIIDILVKKENISLFYNHPFVNQVLIFDRKKNKIFEIFKLLKKIRKEKYDFCINAQRFFTSGLITVFSKSKIKIGFKKNPFSFLFNYAAEHLFDGRHEIVRNFELLKYLGFLKLENPKLYPSANENEFTSIYKKSKYICISPASLWFTKQFPIHKWLELINNVPDYFTIYILGSKNDFNLGTNIINESVRNNVINLCGKLSLLETTSLIKDAAMNYTNDSAVLHLASAVDANVCAIFCSTIKDFGFGPLSNNSFLVQTKENLPCRPCGIHGLKACPEKHFKCANSIDLNDLLEPLNHFNK